MFVFVESEALREKNRARTVVEISRILLNRGRYHSLHPFDVTRTKIEIDSHKKTGISKKNFFEVFLPLLVARRGPNSKPRKEHPEPERATWRALASAFVVSSTSDRGCMQPGLGWGEKPPKKQKSRLSQHSGRYRLIRKAFRLMELTMNAG